MFYLKFLVAAFFLTQCSVMGPVREDKAAQGYQVGELGSAWERMGEKGKEKDSEMGQAFRHKKSGAVIAVNSICYRYETESLQSLTKQLTQPLGAKEVIEEKTYSLDGRDAYETRVKGTLDGVPVEAVFVALRKNRCLFDFSLNASPHLKQADIDSFEKFKSGFHYGSP